MDYGEPPGNPNSLVEDARPTVLQGFLRGQPPFSNYRFWLAAGFLVAIFYIFDDSLDS